MEGGHYEIHFLLNLEESAWSSAKGDTAGPPTSVASGEDAGCGSWVPLMMRKEPRYPPRASVPRGPASDVSPTS